MIVCGDFFRLLPSVESKKTMCCPALPEVWVPANAGTHAELLYMVFYFSLITWPIHLDVFAVGLTSVS